jgi:hypothetical protein
MILEDLREEFAKKQNEIVIKRRAGKFSNENDDIAEQKSVWDWYKAEEYKITGNNSSIISEAKSRATSKFDELRKKCFWENTLTIDDLKLKTLEIFNDYEDELLNFGLKIQKIKNKDDFISKAITILEKFSKNKKKAQLVESDNDLCGLLAIIVKQYFDEVENGKST